MYMNKEIFISTGAFRTRKLNEILGIASRLKIRNIEISPGLDYSEDTESLILQNRREFDFLIHNYFPTPRNPFALNLASDNDRVIEKSLNMCTNAIDFSAAMGLSHYSVHCGYCFDTDGSALGKKEQVSLSRIPYKKAKEIFCDNVRKLCKYGLEKGIGIAIENNVMADFANCDKELYLGVDTEDIKELLKMIDMPNIGVLIDLAHAKVSNTFLEFGVENMVTELFDKIIEVHISDNNGKQDENKQIKENSDIVSCLKAVPNVPIVLEIYNLSEKEILDQISLAESIIG